MSEPAFRPRPELNQLGSLFFATSLCRQTSTSEHEFTPVDNFGRRGAAGGAVNRASRLSPRTTERNPPVGSIMPVRRRDPLFIFRLRRARVVFSSLESQSENGWADA
jgi:hypothetical protein